MNPQKDSRLLKSAEDKILFNEFPEGTSSENQQFIENSLTHTGNLEINEVAAWQKIRNKIIVNQVSIKKKPFNKYIIQIAAAIVLLIVSALVTYDFIEEASKPTRYLSENTQKNITLSDGSQVTLNKNSELVVSNDFGKTSRILELNGEALFSVTKSVENKKFTVCTNNGNITVLGTVFNINTKESTQVYVQRGKVAISDKQKKNEIILFPGDLGEISKNGKVTSKAGESNLLFWKTKRLKFKAEKLSEIIKFINTHFNSKVKIDQSLENCQVTLDFNVSDLNDFFIKLQKIKKLEISNQNGEYFINGEAC